MSSQLARPLARPAAFGLIAGITFLMVFLANCVLHTMEWRMTFGLPVRLLRPAPTAAGDSYLKPVLISISPSAHGRPPDLLIAGRPVPRSQLAAILRSELSHRPPDWPVYVEGGPGLEWGDVASVIDIVRGMPSPVVLLTRRP